MNTRATHHGLGSSPMMGVSKMIIQLLVRQSDRASHRSLRSVRFFQVSSFKSSVSVSSHTSSYIIIVD